MCHPHKIIINATKKNDFLNFSNQPQTPKKKVKITLYFKTITDNKQSAIEP